MDQGDNQLPFEFGSELALFDADWEASTVAQPANFPLLSSGYETRFPERLDNTSWLSHTWSESSMPWECQPIPDLATVPLNTEAGIFESSRFTFPLDASLSVMVDDANWPLEVGVDERALIRPGNSAGPRATTDRLENQSSLNGRFAPEPLLPTTNSQLWQSRPPVESRQSHKPRLLCPHHGCKSTFPRNYELQRHEKNVHNRTFSLLCPKYGCNRSSKPFGRPDKLKEHWRKHQRPNNFLCPIDTCRAGPFSTADLRGHLKASHSKPQVHQSHFADLLCLVNCDLRLTPIGGGLFCLDERDACPLAFLGCSFRYSHQLGSGPGSLRSHLRKHELVERAKGYNAIVAVYLCWAYEGITTCPVCNERVCGPDDSQYNFFRHLFLHSKTERAQHAKELFEMLQPYLLGKTGFCCVKIPEILQEIREEAEGGFRASVSDVVQ